MKMTKSRVSMAVAAVLSAACLMPATSFAYSVNTQGNLRGTLNTSSGGDTLLFPIYTVANGMVSSFSVTNTSDTETVAAKVRFREQEHSVDALDFYVILSPNDKFDFWLSMDDASGYPQMSWQDNSCVVGPDPNAPVAADGTRSTRFVDYWQPFVSNKEQLELGHMEVLGLANLQDITALRQAAKHGSNGKPGNCGLIRDVFANPAKVNELNRGLPVSFDAFTTMRNEGLRSAGNVLVGRYALTLPGKGLEGAGDAIAIRDTNLADPKNPDPNNRNDNTPDGMWHMTAQSGSPCNDVRDRDNNVVPADMRNCRSSNLYQWDAREWDHPHLGEMQDLAGFQTALGAANVLGDWSNNPGNYVGVDWVLSFPTKYAYMDMKYNANNNTWYWVVLDHPTAQGNNTAADRVWPAGCVNTRLTAYSTEEQQSGTPISVSPGIENSLRFCNELNVFTLSTGTGDVEPSVIQRAEKRQVVVFDYLEVPRGWAKLDLEWPTAKPADVTGVLFTIRHDPSNVLINKASLTELQKNVGL